MINKEKFEQYLSEVLKSGQRNRYLKGCVNKAKFYQFEEDEALALIKAHWGADWNKTDEKSFRNAWKNTRVNETIDDYTAKSKLEKLQEISKKIDNSQNEAQINLNLELLKRRIADVKFPTYDNIEFTKTTKDLLYWFKENDLIWFGKNPADTSINVFRDVKEFTTFTKPLSIYSYMCFNPFIDDVLTRSDNEIKEFRYILLESDDLDLETQAKMWQDMINFGIPVKSVIYSGGKSFHALIKIKDICNVTEYKEYCEKIHALFKAYLGQAIDEACKNPSRLSRSPFGTYDKPGPNEGNCQDVLYIDPSFDVNVDAYTKFKEYFDKIGLIAKVKETKKDKISDNELLYYMDRSIVYDIWGESTKFYWRIKDFSGRNSYIQEVFTNRSRLNECCLQFIAAPYRATITKVNDMKDFTIKYKQTIFQPCLKKDLIVDEYLVNEFKPGFLSDIINDDKIPSQLTPELKILVDNIFGNNIEEKNWTLQWMRNFMHNFDKMLTAPVFWDKPGTGKSMIVEAFGKAIGSYISPKQTQIEDSRFNSWVKNAVIILDEVSCGNKKDGKAFGDYLKGLITQRIQTIEHKGKDIIEVEIPNCFIFTANTNNYIPPVYLEENDRRYTIIRNDDSKNLQELWSRETFDKWDNGILSKILIKWIYNLPEDKSINISRGLPTKYKNEILDMSKNNIQIIAEEYYEDHKGEEFISNENIKIDLKNNYNIDYSLTFRRILIQLGCTEKVKYTKDYQGNQRTFRGLKF